MLFTSSSIWISHNVTSQTFDSKVSVLAKIVTSTYIYIYIKSLLMNWKRDYSTGLYQSLPVYKWLIFDNLCKLLYIKSGTRYASIFQYISHCIFTLAIDNAIFSLYQFFYGLNLSGCELSRLIFIYYIIEKLI